MPHNGSKEVFSALAPAWQRSSIRKSGILRTTLMPEKAESPKDADTSSSPFEKKIFNSLPACVHTEMPQ